MQQQNIQQQIVALVQAAAQGDQKATQQIQQIIKAAQNGDQQAMQIAQMIQQVIESMKKQTPAAKYGAKLNYIKQIKGACPDGEELVYFKQGGRMCKVCQQKMSMSSGGQTPKTQKNQNAVQRFKTQKAKMPTKYDPKKHDRLSILNSQGKATKDQKDSLRTYEKLYRNLPAQVRINTYGDMEEYDKTVRTNACGAKIKKKK